MSDQDYEPPPFLTCKDCGEEAGSPWATAACRFEVES